MLPLWRLDQEAFRAIHVGLHRDWLDPLMLALSASGLGYGQVSGLVAGGLRSRFGRAPVWVAAILLGGLTAALSERSVAATLVAVIVALCLAWMPRTIAWCSLASLVVAGLARLAVVPWVGRDRPSNLGFAHPLEPPMGSTSFPSGHATTTFAIAAVLVWAYCRMEDHWIAWTGLGWAVFVGLARVYVGVHYPLDVVGGAALGTASGSVFYWIWLKRGWLDQARNAPIERNLE